VPDSDNPDSLCLMLGDPGPRIAVIIDRFALISLNSRDVSRGAPTRSQSPLEAEYHDCDWEFWTKVRIRMYEEVLPRTSKRP